MEQRALGFGVNIRPRKAALAYASRGDSLSALRRPHNLRVVIVARELNRQRFRRSWGSQERRAMKQIRHPYLRMRSLLGTLLAALALTAQPLGSQAQDEAVRIEEHLDQALQPLTAAEIQQATTVLQRDDRARARLATGQRVRTVSVERHEDDKGAPTGQRRADVVLYNYDTNETISAIVALDPMPRIEHLTVIRDQPPGLGIQEVEEAQQLALGHPTVQAELQAAGLAGRESDLLITHIRVQAAAPGDPCSTDRCVALFFNTRDAVLDIQPVVNLTTGEVEVQ